MCVIFIINKIICYIKFNKFKFKISIPHIDYTYLKNHNHNCREISFYEYDKLKYI